MSHNADKNQPMDSLLQRALTLVAALAAIGAIVGLALIILGAANDWPGVELAGQVLFGPAALGILLTGLGMCLRMYAAPIAWAVQRLLRR